MIRIRGIVKISQTVRNRLQAGIPAGEAANFKQFVTDSIETIERLCAEARVTPDQLPSPSRRAFHFLKQVDLDNLPVREEADSSQPERKISLRNITTHQRAVLQMISKLAGHSPPAAAARKKLSKTLGQSVTSIERVCARNGISPASLTAPSRRTYAWMKFLTGERNLELHLLATHRAGRLAEKILPLHRRSQPGRSQHVIIQFTNMAGLYKSKTYRNAIVLQISEGFINASDDILEAVVTAALLGNKKDAARRIRDYSMSEEFSDVLMELDLMADVIAEKSRGKCYDLDEIFDRVNRSYFQGRMVKPRLTWGQRFTVRKFAHYEPARDRVVVSLTLDDDRIPRFVVEAVLYHELLHKHHGERRVGGRLMAHTPEFRRDERKFQSYEQAQRWIKKLAAR